MEVILTSPLQRAILLLLLCILSVALPGKPARAEQGATAAPVAVKSYIDKESAGWAHKKSDVAFVAESGGCRIQWNVVQYKEKNSKRDIMVTRQCRQSVASQLPLHRAIAEKVFAQWPVSEFDTLLWGSFCRDTDWSWCVPIAVASSKSADYTDYKKNYPNSKIHNLNGVYMQLADETDAYKELRQLLKPFGADVIIAGVEKVFAMKVKELPETFAAELKRQGVKEDTRVMYDVGSSYFKIIK